MNQAEMLARFAREGDFDVFMVAGRYTLLDQPALRELLPLCEEKGISVVAVGVMNSGHPRGSAARVRHFDYRPAPDDLLERARRIAAVCERHGVPLKAAAIRFPLAHPAVVSVAAGVRTIDHFEDYPRALDDADPGRALGGAAGRGLIDPAAPVPAEGTADAERHLPRIDSHHHFWDPSRAEYPFLTAELAAIRRPFGPDDLRPSSRPRASPAPSSCRRARRPRRRASSWPWPSRSRSWPASSAGWTSRAPDAADDIAGLRAEPGGDRLVGIRHQVHDEPDPDWLRRPDVRRGLLSVQEAGLAYDLLVRARELPAAVDTVRAFPELRFVLDHLAKPPIADGDLSEWAPGILALADVPNVSAKISGLVTEADWRSWSLDDLRGPVEIAVDAFGADRLMIGSDWPVCLLAGSYAEVLGAMRALLDELPAHDLDRILGGTAARVYRLALTG